jgi:hypothetical protein
MTVKSRLAMLGLASAVTLGTIATTQPAQARVFIGVGIGAPFYGPRFYPRPFYRPYYPYYYAPAPVYYPPYNPVPGGFTCYAGPYVCPLHYAHPINAPCSCPVEGGGREGGVTR